MAHLEGRAASSSCLLCHQPDSKIHMLSSCQNTSIQNMVTERHNNASRLIIKALNKGDFGGNIMLAVIESETHMAQKSSLTGTCSQQDFTPMASTKPVSKRTLILLKTRCYLHTANWNEENGLQRDIQTVHPSRWDERLIEAKYCDDTRLEQQLARATELHSLC